MTIELWDGSQKQMPTFCFLMLSSLQPLIVRCAYKKQSTINNSRCLFVSNPVIVLLALQPITQRTLQLIVNFHKSGQLRPHFRKIPDVCRSKLILKIDKGILSLNANVVFVFRM